MHSVADLVVPQPLQKTRNTKCPVSRLLFSLGAPFLLSTNRILDILDKPLESVFGYITVLRKWKKEGE